MQNLEYEWVDFQNFPKFEPKLDSNLNKKNGNFGQNLAKNRMDWYMNGFTFSSKNGISMGPL